MAMYPGHLEKFYEDGSSLTMRNTLVLDYLLWELSWDFKAAPIGESLIHVFEKCNERPKLLASVVKLNSTQVIVHLMLMHKDDLERLDPWVCLEFQVIILGHNRKLKKKVMDHNHEYVFFVFHYDDMEDIQKEQCSWGIKIIVKMHEESYVEGDEHRRQELLIERLSLNEAYRKNMFNMAFLYNTPDFSFIFSGRQGYNFARVKARLIEHTLVFADQLAAKKRAKNDNKVYQTKTPPAVYLNYILNGDLKEIEKMDLCELYVRAYHYGLPYLADECRDYMRNHLNDNDFLPYMITYADMVQDLPFIETLIDTFIARIKEVTKTGTWKKMVRKENVLIKNILDLAKRRTKILLITDLDILMKRLLKEAAEQSSQTKQLENQESVLQATEEIPEWTG